MRFGSKIFDYADFLLLKIIKSNHFATVTSYLDYQITLFKDGRMNVYGIENEK